MTIVKNGDQWDKSNVHFENNRIVAYSKTKLYRKMCHIDYGLGLFNKSVFDSYDQRNRFDLAEVYEGLAAQKKLAAFEVFSRFYEIGSHKGLAETEEYLTSGDFNDLRSKAHRRN
jgi:NDP-sugar pyrophosphorylase family protein